MIKWKFEVDKPIFMVLFGHSVKELIRRWDEFKNYDCLWASMNNCDHLATFMEFPIDILAYYCTHINCDLYPHKNWLHESEARGNSLYEFVLQCKENNVRDLILFGADGYSEDKTPYIYGTKGYTKNHIKECEHFNANLPQDMKINIVNVSPHSHYNLNNITYDEFLNNFSYKKKNT